VSTDLNFAEYFDSLGARLARLAHGLDVEIEPPVVSPAVFSEVLQLAGTVAHTSERKFAPVATFLTGIAVGELRAAGRLGSAAEVAASIAQLRKELDERFEPTAGRP